jgi:hypothetical protein
MNREMHFEKAFASSCLSTRVLQVGIWVLEGYCRHERMALALTSAGVHPQGSLRHWRVTALGYRFDGSFAYLDAEVRQGPDGQMRAWAPGFNDSASFDPSSCWDLLNEHRPMNLASTIARLPHQVWNAAKACWEKGPAAAVADSDKEAAECAWQWKVAQDGFVQPSNRKFFLRDSEGPLGCPQPEGEQWREARGCAMAEQQCAGQSEVL